MRIEPRGGLVENRDLRALHQDFREPKALAHAAGEGRDAFVGGFGEALGEDGEQIARALGRSDGATKVLLHRAIRQLEGIVADDSEPAQAGSGA